MQVRGGLLAVISTLLLYANPQDANCEPAASPFPGVSRDLASFCAARPSLPVELASMIVHVKRNTSFNYKLYLFSADHVFQTGQVIPRGDFRIHSFPVKAKTIGQFWPGDVDTYRFSSSRPDSLVRVASSSFNLKQFLSRVPLAPDGGQDDGDAPRRPRRESAPDVPGDPLPGDAGEPKPNPNEHIQFDRDDQVSALTRRAHSIEPAARRPTGESAPHADSITPVAAFSGFHVNTTYLVRKDFDQREPQIVRLLVHSAEFRVTQLDLVSNGTQPVASYPTNEDYNFLMHKLLRDPNTRITAINQIYEDWITRNFYTVVYVQRRLDEPGERRIVNDRLVFRGTSIALLGADQLDYSVKAAAFITEKNGLHYYLEFLASNKFYLCAVDWTRRPFKMIDSQRFPIKATRTQLDNEELLLCPPAVCYSNRPIDELVGYGRLAMGEREQLEAAMLTSTTSSASPAGDLLAGEPSDERAAPLGAPASADGSRTSAGSSQNIDLDALVAAVRAAAGRLEARLHLRDWVWTMERRAGGPRGEPFETHYELARRNDIKANPDSYGYVLTGQEIDAAYRVYNELYLVTANQLISINYTLPNETVTSSHPLGDEFQGLSSTLIDPVTGAFYDRYANQIYFFKGDRYVGYDYAKKRPLDEFQLQVGELQRPLVSSLPVVGILGRQHQVDGVYHDLPSDAVFVFSGMKFYSFPASEFKEGTFRPQGESLPEWRCINEHFLGGCNFDRVYPNPCKSALGEEAALDEHPDGEAGKANETEGVAVVREPTFTEQQQSKLRSIAARGGLLDILVESSLLTKGAARLIEPLVGGQSTQQPQERIIIYLLMAMVVMTALATIAMIVLVVSWSRAKGQAEEVDTLRPAAILTTRQLPAPPAETRPVSHYLSNQQYQRTRQHRHQLDHLNSSHGSPKHHQHQQQARHPAGSSSLVGKSRRHSAELQEDIDSSVL